MDEALKDSLNPAKNPLCRNSRVPRVIRGMYRIGREFSCAPEQGGSPNYNRLRYRSGFCEFLFVTSAQAGLNVLGVHLDVS